MSMHCDLTAVAMKHLSNLDLSICDFYCCYVIKFVVNVICALMIVSEGNMFMFWINVRFCMLVCHVANPSKYCPLT